MSEEIRRPDEETTAEDPEGLSEGRPAPLDNPLQGPVPGRRDAMEFPITDVGNCPEVSADAGDSFVDDFDYPVEDTDDFDI